jgi:hypothetical protein
VVVEDRRKVDIHLVLQEEGRRPCKGYAGCRTWSSTRSGGTSVDSWWTTGATMSNLSETYLKAADGQIIQARDLNPFYNRLTVFNTATMSTFFTWLRSPAAREYFFSTSYTFFSGPAFLTLHVVGTHFWGPVRISYSASLSVGSIECISRLQTGGFLWLRSRTSRKMKSSFQGL